MVESVSLGIPKLDRILLNGVPKGFTILLKGTPGSGMELFAKQFAAAGVGTEDVIYFSTNERATEVLNTMRQFNWPTNIEVVDVATEYFERVLAKELEISKLRLDGLSVTDLLTMDDVYSDRREEINFLSKLVYEISDLTPPYRVIIDSLDFYLEHYSGDDVLSSVRTIKAHTHYNKSVTLMTMVSEMHEKRIEHGIEAIADCIIELEIQKVASEFETRMIVRKVRNYPNKTAILTYSITERGITPEMVSRVM